MKTVFLGLLILLALIIGCKHDAEGDAVAKPAGGEATRPKPADGWVEFSSPEGDFAIDFPQSPSDKLLGTENGAVTRAVSASVNDAVIYEVLYASFPEQPLSPEDVTKAKDGYFRGLGKCSVEYDRPASPALEDYLGRSYRAQCTSDDGTSLTTALNVYAGKRHYFTSSVLWRSDDPEPADAARFLGSLRLLERGK